MSKVKWTLSILLVLLAILIWLGWKYTLLETPQTEISLALQHISEAEKMKSLEYAQVTFHEAQRNYDSAMYYWKLENSKWFYQRNFEKAIASAKKSSQLSAKAIIKAKASSKNIKLVLKQQIEELNEKVNQYQHSYKNIPLEKNQRENWTRGKILLEEGILAFKSSNYLVAAEKLDSAQLIIHEIFTYPKEILSSYFAEYPTWAKWVDEFVAKSKKKRSTVIVVDKYGRKCHIYKSGVLHAEHDIELSPYWIGDKRFQGDRATPEGHYKITRKKAKGDTKYYKALLLDYPNEEDKERFKQNMESGKIDPKAKIGGLIEIHGHGGKGLDWTDGCVALPDHIMDKVFEISQVGMEVLIVGSLKPLDEM